MLYCFVKNVEGADKHKNKPNNNKKKSGGRSAKLTNKYEYHKHADFLFLLLLFFPFFFWFCYCSLLLLFVVEYVLVGFGFIIQFIFLRSISGKIYETELNTFSCFIMTQTKKKKKLQKHRKQIVKRKESTEKTLNKKSELNWSRFLAGTI